VRNILVITLYTLQTSEVAYCACRARRDEVVALVATCCVVYSEHDTARTTVLYQNAWARWRVVRCRDVMHQVEFELYSIWSEQRYNAP